MEKTTPTFICIGPSKSATTWLSDHLKPQLDIWLPPIQELSYPYLSFGPRLDEPDLLTFKRDWWSTAKRMIRNKSISEKVDREFYLIAQKLKADDPTGEDFEGYMSLFAPAKQPITGDISPIYASFTDSQVKSFSQSVPSNKVFMFVRHPVDRFFSHYKMMASYQRYGDIDYTSKSAVEKFLNDPIRSAQFYPTVIYARWKKHWGESFSVFFFDDVKKNPTETLNKVIRYVGGNPMYRIPFVSSKINRNKVKLDLRIPKSTVAMVYESFLPELTRCDEIFSHKGYDWALKAHQLLDSK